MSEALRRSTGRPDGLAIDGGPVRLAVLGFLFWLAFLLALEPGNVWSALSAGVNLTWTREAMRICGGGLLGAAATPALDWLVLRFPIRGPGWLRNAAVQLGATTALAVALIVIAHFLALWLLDGRPVFSMAGLGGELASNALLLVFCMGAWIALAHGRFAARHEPRGEAAAHPSVIESRSKGRLIRIPLADVDWIETQGNYVALHAGGASTLVRETLTALEARLDPRRFVRIHRRMILAADRVVEVRPATNGDAMVRLCDGRLLRVSRLYRERLRRAVEALR
jgi:hypothetical protein